MKELKRKRLNHGKQLEDVPELIQLIQSLLPAKDAACSCVLSKTWLRAWSTISTLRFCRPGPLMSLIKQRESTYMKLIRRTIRRYCQENIPIITCDLYFAIHEQKSATRVEKSIKSVASKSCLKELRLKIFGDIASFNVPDETFSSENLNTLSIKVDFPPHTWTTFSLHISSNPLINCVNLRELELIEVHISEEAFHNLLSTCKLLEKINLIHEFHDGLNKIKVNDLHRLQQLKIGSRNVDIEISDVPSLRSFHYYSSRLMGYVRALFEIGLIKSLRELCLENVLFNDALSDMIKSKFPFLESLKLEIRHCQIEIVDIKCATLQRLEIDSWVSTPIKVQVNALKLLKLLFHLEHHVSMPSLLFPSAAPEQIQLGLVLSKPIDHLLFLKIWETLDLSSEFNIEIQTYLDADKVKLKIDDVRRRVSFPATNVKSLFFHIDRNDWGDNSVLVFDAFFSICQPMYVAACSRMGLKLAKYFLKLAKKGARKKNTVKVYWRQSRYLRRNPFTQENGIEGKWEKLTSASVRSLEGTLPDTRRSSVYRCDTSVSEFKLTWSSP